jgi:hypothetical protein
MPRKQLRFGRGFSVALTNRRGQAATMVLAPGGSEGGDRTPLKTLNLYVPPAYTGEGDPLPAGRK